jgi:hypothetical protein
MLNPRVGDILDIFSPTSLLRIVVFPALSNPLSNQLDLSRGLRLTKRRAVEVEGKIWILDVQEKNPHFL